MPVIGKEKSLYDVVDFHLETQVLTAIELDLSTLTFWETKMFSIKPPTSYFFCRGGNSNQEVTSSSYHVPCLPWAVPPCTPNRLMAHVMGNGFSRHRDSPGPQKDLSIPQHVHDGFHQTSPPNYFLIKDLSISSPNMESEPQIYGVILFFEG